MLKSSKDILSEKNTFTLHSKSSPWGKELFYFPISVLFYCLREKKKKKLKVSESLDVLAIFALACPKIHEKEKETSKTENSKSQHISCRKVRMGINFFINTR